MVHPDWAVKYRRPGTELRLINGCYCLYECRCVYDKEKKHGVKKTGRYLGSITEEGGFKESRKRLAERELEQAREEAKRPEAVLHVQDAVVGESKELGLSRFVSGCLPDYIGKLREVFPDDWERIMALAYCRLREQSPLKAMSSVFGDSYLSVEHKVRGLSPNALSGFYHDIGTRRPQILAFLRKFCQEDTGVIFDGTDILSASKRMDLPRLSKVKSGGFDMATNIMFGYSLAAGHANYYRLLPGNIKDVKAFKICAQEYGCTDMTAIVDKGFQSDENIKFIDSMEGVSVIMALRRNTGGLDYTPFANRDNKGALGHFWYGGRVIWYHKQEVYGHTAYLYLDEKRRVEEQEDYLAKVDDAENDHYTMESYNEHVMQFGTIALLVTQEKSAEDTYYAYKSRGEVEQCIDVFKNTLEADTSYMQTEQALETWMFINMVAMHWYCELRQRMVDSKLIEKYSPRDMIRVMGRLRSVYVNGKWHTTEITAKEGRLLSAIGVDIT